MLKEFFSEQFIAKKWKKFRWRIAEEFSSSSFPEEKEKTRVWNGAIFQTMMKKFVLKNRQFFFGQFFERKIKPYLLEKSFLNSILSLSLEKLPGQNCFSLFNIPSFFIGSSSAPLNWWMPKNTCPNILSQIESLYNFVVKTGKNFVHGWAILL